MGEGGAWVCVQVTSLTLNVEQNSAISQSIWAQQFGEPGLFPAPKMTGLYLISREEFLDQF